MARHFSLPFPEPGTSVFTRICSVVGLVLRRSFTARLETCTLFSGKMSHTKLLQVIFYNLQFDYIPALLLVVHDQGAISGLGREISRQVSRNLKVHRD